MHKGQIGRLRYERINVYLTSLERKALDDLAVAEGKPLGTYVREVMLHLAAERRESQNARVS